jgi:hypothetical protein
MIKSGFQENATHKTAKTPKKTGKTRDAPPFGLVFPGL